MFVKVAETGNMSAAGRELGLSPAVVSKRISVLEERLNIRLFQRTTRQLSLTDAGTSYYNHIVKAIEQVDRAEDSLFAASDNEPAGLLKLTGPTSLAQLNLSAHLKKFLAAYPKIQLDLCLTDKLIDITGDGFDIGIRIGATAPRGLVAVPLLSNTRVMVAHKSYLEKHGRPKKPSDLENHNCLTGSNVHSWTLKGPRGDEPVRVNGNLRSNSNDFLFSQMLDGQGIVMSSSYEIANHKNASELEHVLPAYHGSCIADLTLLHAPKEILPAKIEVFIDFMTDAFSGRNG